MFVIPIKFDTLDLIAPLNGGLRPSVEKDTTFFIYRGEEEYADIVDAIGLLQYLTGRNMTTYPLSVIE